MAVMGTAWAVNGPPPANEPAHERISEVSALQQNIGRYKLRAGGSVSQDVVRLRGGVDAHHLGNTPWFLTTEARMARESRSPYDLNQLGAHVGLGWAFNEADNLLGKFRFDHYKVSNTGPNVDPAFRSVAGRSRVTALGLEFQHDTRDDFLYATAGARAKLGGELAMEALGGDYNFGRLESDFSVYRTPFQALAAWWQDVTLVEHFRIGWVSAFGDTDAVPFFERYFVGGSSTVRGYRDRWLTPRGLEEQFVGGEWQVINNLEARKPIFARYFHRNLSAAVFVDVGRASRRFSEIGDFGVGIGGGLRYAVRLGPVHAVARVDYAFSLDHEGDDSVSRLHLTLGMPF